MQSAAFLILCLNYFVLVQPWLFLTHTFQLSAETTNGKSASNTVSHKPGRSGKSKLVVFPNMLKFPVIQVSQVGRHPEVCAGMHEYTQTRANL